RVAFDLIDHAADLIDVRAICRRPGAPLVSVDWPEVSVRVGPLVPDGDLVLVQEANVRIPSEKPKQLVDDRAKVQLLCGQQRKPVAEVEAHLVAKDAERSGAGAV